jgi:GNAT superfamily N-acetyltransferase
MQMLSIMEASDADLESLAVMNKQLIEDEKHDNKMDIAELKERMRNFIHTVYKAYIFMDSGITVGYALADHSREPIYLRHFFICRGSRRNGYGTAAFNRLAELIGTQRIDIEVMSWNHTAIAFWSSLGFKERSIYMRK